LPHPPAVYSPPGQDDNRNGAEVWRINPFEVTDRTKDIVEQNIAFVLRNYIKANYEYVILAWVLHQQSIIDRLLSKLDDLKVTVHIFTLICDEETLKERLRRENNKGRELERAIERLRQSLTLETEKFGTAVMKPDKVVSKIVEAVICWGQILKTLIVGR
tara:strand:+ start:168 stop:647 length:480 start_codon:yes stop_codon:yes gene_type:complete